VLINKIFENRYLFNKYKNEWVIEKCGYDLVGEIRFPRKEKSFYCYEKILNKANVL
jgi:hypothetical protein